MIKQASIGYIGQPNGNEDESFSFTRFTEREELQIRQDDLLSEIWEAADCGGMGPETEEECERLVQAFRLAGQ